MEKIILTPRFALFTGTLLVFPTLYFVISAILNYSFGFPALWKIMVPVFEKPENNHFGFNINVLILFNPLLALVLNLPQVVSLKILQGKDYFNFHLAAKKHSWNWWVVTSCLFCLSSLCLYLVAENCI